MIKRLIDVFVALIGLVLLSPFFLMLWVSAKLSRKGSSLASDERIGKDLIPIRLYRFNIAENQQVETTTTTHIAALPKRLNRISRILCFFKIDSWPLLFNVLKGDLSLVGPRPEKREFVENYTNQQKLVLTVRPGIWGPNGYLNDIDDENFPEKETSGWKEDYVKYVLPAKLKAELEYVQNHQIGKDVRVFLQAMKLNLRRAIYDQLMGDARSYNFILPLDLILLSLSYFLAYQLRFDWNVPSEEYTIFIKCLPFVIILRIATFYYFGIYKNLWKYINVRDLVTIIYACTVSSILIVALISLFGEMGHSRSIYLIDWLLSISLIGGSRLAIRFSGDFLTSENKVRNNVLIIGTGDVGEMLLKMLDINGRDRYNIVGFIDNDPLMNGRMVHGFNVLGACQDIPELAPMFRVDEVLIAEPKLSADEMKQIIKYCKQANLRHRIVPAVNDILSGSVHLSKFRDVEISDLFGRQTVDLDLSAIESFLMGKKVLVTGAGGSIGSELCRQIAEQRPKHLVLVDKNENYLYEIQCELNSQFPSLVIHCHLGSITNRQKLRRIFEAYRPEIVFHAAAQKHVPLSENNYEEAIWNNVFGTHLLADTSDEFGVSDFVMVSTDKAVNPTSIMGATKRIAELYIQALAKKSRTNYVTVRFGNVLNSNGSVIPIFRKQIEKGGPITITHPDVERYFMSIAEAVQLILQAVTMGKSGEIFILEMGKSIRIMEMAIELISQAGFKPFEDIPIKIVGLRPGEKLFEELIGENEELLPTTHASIKTVKSNYDESLPKIAKKISDLVKFDFSNGLDKLLELLHEIVPEYTPYLQYRQNTQNGTQKPSNDVHVINGNGADKPHLHDVSKST